MLSIIPPFIVYQIFAGKCSKYLTHKVGANAKVQTKVIKEIFCDKG
jgi:hypothetical protein